MENCSSCLDVNWLFSFKQQYPHIRTCFHSIFRDFYKNKLKIASVFLEPLLITLVFHNLCLWSDLEAQKLFCFYLKLTLIHYVDLKKKEKIISQCLKFCPHVRCHILTFVHFFPSPPVKVMHKRAVFFCRSASSYSGMSHFPESASAGTERHNVNLWFLCNCSTFRYKLPSARTCSYKWLSLYVPCELPVLQWECISCHLMSSKLDFKKKREKKVLMVGRILRLYSEINFVLVIIFCCLKCYGKL